MTRLRGIAGQFGIAFQLRDDILDLSWEKGRDRTANDVREGKPSYLVAWLEERGGLSRGERSRLRELLSTDRDATDEAEVLWFENLVRERGAVHASTQYQRRLFRGALDALRELESANGRFGLILERLMTRLAL